MDIKNIAYNLIGWGLILSVFLSPVGVIVLLLNDIRNNTENRKV